MNNYNLDNFEPAARIVVIGVGGAGNNAVNRMIDEDIQNVEFYVMNTDKQALSTSKAVNRIPLGEEITNGLGAGGDPHVGEEAAEASKDDIAEVVKGANLVFIAAGMGGGTGTGAAPVVARIAREAGALVVAIVTRPFTFEGKKRISNSVEGLNKLKENVDSFIVVGNDRLLVMSGNAPISEAFSQADKVLAQSVKTVVNLILLPAIINLDYADVKSTLKDSGVALIGFGQGSGPSRSKDAANNAINSPLLEASIKGARRAIIAVTCGPEVSLFEAQDTVNRIIGVAGRDIDIKFGININYQLSDEIIASVIASDFEEEIDFSKIPPFNPLDALGSPAKTAGTQDTLLGVEKVEQASVTNAEDKKEETDEDSILPSFLKNL